MKNAAFNRLTERAFVNSLPHRTSVDEIGSLDKYSQVSGILSAAGVDAKSVAFLIGEIQREDPDIDPMHMVQRALELNRPTYHAPLPPKAVVEKKDVRVMEMSESDLRRLTNGSGNAYETLLQAGLIKKPVLEFRIVR